MLTSFDTCLLFADKESLIFFFKFDFLMLLTYGLQFYVTCLQFADKENFDQSKVATQSADKLLCFKSSKSFKYL